MLTLLWDIDDVLNGLMGNWLDYYCATGKNASVNLEDIKDNPPLRSLHISMDEYLKSLDGFRGEAYKNLQPSQPVMKWFEKHGKNCRHAALTAVPHGYASLSAEWCVRHYGRWIRSFNFVPSFRRNDSIPEYDTNKKDFIQNHLKCDIFIDDNEKTITEAGELGIAAVLFPAPWNTAGNRAVDDFLAELTDLIYQD